VGTLTGVPRPATGKTPLRNFRISDAVYDPANRVAAARGEALTDVVEKALAAYYRRHRDDDPGPDVDLQELRATARKRTARDLMTGKPNPAARRTRGQDPPA
jgi:hypothetical protein